MEQSGGVTKLAGLETLPSDFVSHLFMTFNQLK